MQDNQLKLLLIESNAPPVFLTPGPGPATMGSEAIRAQGAMKEPMRAETGAKRKMYNTTLDAELIRKIKILAAQLEKRQNDLLEEAIRDLLHKYGLSAQ